MVFWSCQILIYTRSCLILQSLYLILWINRSRIILGNFSITIKQLGSLFWNCQLCQKWLINHDPDTRQSPLSSRPHKSEMANSKVQESVNDQQQHMVKSGNITTTPQSDQQPHHSHSSSRSSAKYFTRCPCSHDALCLTNKTNSTVWYFN